MKLIYSYFDKEKKETTVIIQNKYGAFTGKSYLHPEDEEYYSNYFGFSLAELRAQKKFLKYKKRIIREQYSTLIMISKNLYNELSFRGRGSLIDLIENKRKLISNLDKNIIYIDKSIKERIEAREKIIKQIKKGKNG